MKSNFVFKKITKYDKSTLDGLNKLLLQWSRKGYQMSPQYFKKLIRKSHVLCLYDNDSVIGTVTLIELQKLSGLKGSVEHLILDERYRGQGLGKKLMIFAMSVAKKINIEALFLTCEPDRLAANALYKKLGFEIKKTNFYQLIL